MAAMYRNVNGLLGLARMHSGLPRDWIPELIEVPVHNDLTVILLLRAFEEGSKEAASALTSLCNGSFVAQNPKILVQCLTALDPDAQAPLKVVPEGKNDFGWSNFGLTEIQRLMMLAELYEKEKESLSAAIELYERAAEEAMAMGKGQQSTKLFMKVEELQALLPDEEEEEAA
ncbi:hypothetical protein DIPPA_13798 [Diplonema papillatum]|nr:hypothetical protein DIPPA_13798 [Diplonema papillatum]